MARSRNEYAIGVGIVHAGMLFAVCIDRGTFPAAKNIKTYRNMKKKRKNI